MIIKRKLYSKISGLPRVARNISYKVMKKRPGGARKAVMVGQGARNAEAWWYTTTPGQKTSNIVKFILSKPAGSATWLATAATPLPSTPISMAVEKAAQKVPIYRKGTGYINTSWNGSLPDRLITSAGNTLAAMPI